MSSDRNCTSTYVAQDGAVYECAGISCPISEWLGLPARHKAWAVDVVWTDAEAVRSTDDPTLAYSAILSRESRRQHLAFRVSAMVGLGFRQDHFRLTDISGA